MAALAYRSGPWKVEQAGVTLIELVTVIVILGVVSAIAAPRLFDSSEFSERGYIDELSSALRYAQRVAITSDCEVSIRIDDAGYSASLRGDENACDHRSGPFSTPVLRADRTPLSRSTPSDVVVTGAGTIVFDRDGSIENAVPPSFTIGPFALSLDRETGTATVTP